MLHYSTVEPHTLDILKRLMEIPELNDFYLVGGTALSLLYGHQKSIDIDLFSTVEFANDIIIPPLEKQFPGFKYRNTNNPVGLFGSIDDIKTDFVKHHFYRLIEKSIFLDGIRFFSVADIIAMKIAAILKRGVEKDFWDISELLSHYTVNDFVIFYTAKYPSQQLLISIPFALTYFEDAEESEDPVSMKGQTWESVKTFIRQKVNEYLK